MEIFFTPQVPEYMVTDVLRYWVLAYHVDGFHIIGDVPLNRIASDPMLADTKLFAGNWNGADRGRRKHLLEYNDGFLTDMRCLIKGDEDCLNQLMFRTRRNPEDMGVVNYMAHTNGFTLMDMVSYDRKHMRTTARRTGTATAIIIPGTAGWKAQPGAKRYWPCGKSSSTMR